MNITLIGMPGSGKSYISKNLSEISEYELIELDFLMEEQFKAPLQQILDNMGEESFLKKQENDAIIYTKNKDNIIISTGGSIIYSDSAMSHLKKISKIIYLETSFETIKTRIGEKPRGIVGIKDKTLKQLYGERTLLYKKWADVTLDAEREASEIIKDINISLISKTLFK